MATSALLNLRCTTMPSKVDVLEKKNMVPSKTQFPEKKNLVLDMGRVLLTYDERSLGIENIINPKIFRHMLQDSIWNDYETGKLAGEHPYDRLSQKFGVPAENIRIAGKMAIESLFPIPEMQNIVNEYREKLRLFCVTNVPAEEFEYLYKKFPDVWQNFEKIFASASVGMRKPSLNFFKYVLQEAGIDPKETVLVDDSFQNCVAAKSLGMTAVLCESIESAVQELNFVLRTEEERLAAARRYLDRVLEHDRRDLDTVSHKGSRLSDNYSEFFIVDVLNDARFFPDIPIPENLEFCYTREKDMSKWTLYPLPNDLDTTSVGMSVLYLHNRVSFEYINAVVDHMLAFQTEDGVLQTYFDISRPRADHVVLANIAMLFHCAGRRLPSGSAEFLYNVLLNRAHVEGSQYYIGPASFLYFLSRIAAKFRDNHFLPSDFIPLLAARVQEALNTQTETVTIAMVVLSCLNLQIEPDIRDVEKLARSQNADGSWDMAFWGKGDGLKFGCKALTTAFALAALERVRDFRQATSDQNGILTLKTAN